MKILSSRLGPQDLEGGIFLYSQNIVNYLNNHWLKILKAL